MPQDLIEAELFGLAQFDGGANSTRGLVEAADGGTLFLDEVAELPNSAQARLLQVMQGENRKIGSSALHQVDVRIIAPTHRNLQELTDSGQFRNDLFYRLNVMTFVLPPLRERKEDILGNRGMAARPNEPAIEQARPVTRRQRAASHGCLSLARQRA